MNFTKDEKLAIAKALEELVISDEVITKEEIAYLQYLDKEFGISLEIFEESHSIRLSNATKSLRNMTFEKKLLLTALLKNLAASDGYIANIEVEVINAVLASAGINHKFVFLD